MVEPHRGLFVVAGIGGFQLFLDIFELTQLVIGDAGRGPRGEFTTDMRLDIGDIGDVTLGHRQHHESAVRLLVEQPFGAQPEQRLTHRGHADTQLGRQLIQPHICSGGVVPVEDSLAHEAGHILGEL